MLCKIFSPRNCLFPKEKRWNQIDDNMVSFHHQNNENCKKSQEKQFGTSSELLPKTNLHRLYRMLYSTNKLRDPATKCWALGREIQRKIEKVLKFRKFLIEKL